MNMNDGDTDTGLEDNGEPAEELPEETGKEEAEAGSDVAPEGESPWVPPTEEEHRALLDICLIYTSPSPRDVVESRMTSSA